MTYCVAVQADIAVPVCPLAKGKCMWQHRQTHVCCYTNQEMTVDQFCTMVGTKGHPTELQVGRFMIKLRQELNKPG